MHKGLNFGLFSQSVLLIVLIYTIAYATGSCATYGHSCWGAHGKRTGAKEFRPPAIYSPKAHPNGPIFANLGRNLADNGNPVGNIRNDEQQFGRFAPWINPEGGWMIYVPEYEGRPNEDMPKRQQRSKRSGIRYGDHVSIPSPTRSDVPRQPQGTSSF